MEGKSGNGPTLYILYWRHTAIKRCQATLRLWACCQAQTRHWSRSLKKALSIQRLDLHFNWYVPLEIKRVYISKGKIKWTWNLKTESQIATRHQMVRYTLISIHILRCSGLTHNVHVSCLIFDALRMKAIKEIACDCCEKKRDLKRLFWIDPESLNKSCGTVCSKHNQSGLTALEWAVICFAGQRTGCNKPLRLYKHRSATPGTDRLSDIINKRVYFS